MHSKLFYSNAFWNNICFQRSQRRTVDGSSCWLLGEFNMLFCLCSYICTCKALISFYYLFVCLNMDHEILTHLNVVKESSCKTYIWVRRFHYWSRRNTLSILRFFLKVEQQETNRISPAKSTRSLLWIVCLFTTYMFKEQLCFGLSLVVPPSKTLLDS